MHKSCKGNHLHLFHPDRLQQESLTCLIYFCCSQLSKMLDWSSVTFGSWLKKKDDKTWCNVNSNYEICICPWKAFQEYVWNERSELNFSSFLFWQLFIPLAYQFYILNYMIFHTISSYFPFLQWAYGRKAKQQFKIPYDGSELWHGEFLWYEEFGFIQHR